MKPTAYAVQEQFSHNDTIIYQHSQAFSKSMSIRDTKVP